MNGIAGIIHPVGPISAAIVTRMLDRMRSREAGNMTEIEFSAPAVRAGVVASSGDKSTPVPAWSQTGRVGVVLSGENLTPAPGSAALAEAYEQSGEKALLEMNGWFSGLVIDLRTGTVILFNDRHGLGRVYYHESGATFYFASEAKSLLAVLPELRILDARGLAEMFSVGCVMQNRSLYKGICVLPPASAWCFHRDGRVEKRRYFEPEIWEQQPPLSPQAYNDRLCDVFSQLGQRCSDGANVAMSLTGGLDSRAVLAWSKVESGALPCYTFGGPYRDCADVVIARQLAGLCHHPHTTIRVGEDFFTRFSALAEKSVYLSDGTMDVSGAVELHVNEEARTIAPVRLTGNYGSEILRSHVAFRPGRLDRSLFTPEFNTLLDEAAETYAYETACHPLTFIAFKQVPWHHYARFFIEKSQLTPRSPFLDPALVALAYQVPSDLRSSPRPLLQLIARGNPALAGVSTDRALRSTDIPVLTGLAHQWQEFTAKAEYAYDYGMPAWLARADHAMMPLHLEKLFLGRHKFYHFRIWYRDHLRDAVRDQLSSEDDAAGSSCYEPGITHRLTEEHFSGRLNRTLELHRLLSVRLIERLLIRAT